MRTIPAPTDFQSTRDIIRYHRGHYFDKDTMRFFDSRVLLDVYPGKHEVYFVTSERFKDSVGIKFPRAYTVRAFNPSTDAVRTVPPFNKLTRSRALRIARNLADEVKA